MRINPNVKNYNFGRAFSTEEKKAYSALLKDVKKELNIQDTTVIVFDFNVPSEKGYNTGIGTTFSDSMKKFTQFLKSMTGISSIQLQPQGKITQYNPSPYSGTSYAYGEHIIDLKKLSTPEFASLLSETDIKTVDEMYKGDKVAREYKTDYNQVMGSDSRDGIQQQFLKLAFENFETKLSNGDKLAIELNKEFSDFKKENQNWLRINYLFEILSQSYKTPYINKWEEKDKNLFHFSTSEKYRNQRIQELENSRPDIVDYENFKQFIADKQQKESAKSLNSLNIEIYGDCLIGFSKSERWGNINCFRDNLFYGGPDPDCTESNGIQTWGLPALDYTKLGECTPDGDISKLGESGKLLYDKYSIFFKRYNGIRMDAAWQLVTPFVYQAVNNNYEEVKLPEIKFTVFNIIKAAAKNTLGDKFNEETVDKIMLELVGMSAGKSRELTLNTYPHLYTTAYAEYDETPKKFLEKGYKDGKFYVGIGCHDNDSLVNLSRNSEKRKLHIKGMKRDYGLNISQFSFSAPEYKSQTIEEKRQEDFRTAKFGEIFTSGKQFFTLPDMFGMEERINVSGKVGKENWTVRIPSDYEKFYFTQLSKGYGLNFPKSLATAMRMKKSDNKYLIEKCNEAAEILRSDGPMAEQEVNKIVENNGLKNKFEYIS